MSTQSKKTQPPRTDRKDPSARTRKVTLANKVAILSVYETELEAGRDGRDEILEKLAKRYEKSPREVERYIKEARDLPAGEICELLRRWAAEVKDLVDSPWTLLKNEVAGGEDKFLERGEKRLVLRSESVPLHMLKSEGTDRVGCAIETEVLFRLLSKHMAKSKLFRDYEQYSRKSGEYIIGFATEFSRQAYVASEVLQKLGCSNTTRIPFAKTVLQEAISPGLPYGYAIRQKEPRGDEYVLRFGLDVIAIGKSEEPLAQCQRFHTIIRQSCSKEFHPKQQWEKTEELKLSLLAELERLLATYEHVRSDSLRPHRGLLR